MLADLARARRQRTARRGRPQAQRLAGARRAGRRVAGLHGAEAARHRPRAGRVRPAGARCEDALDLRFLERRPRRRRPAPDRPPPAASASDAHATAARRQPATIGRMFTGIITGLGRIVDVQPLGADASHGRRLTIEAPAGYLDDVQLGDSIALNGACMTVTALRRRGRPLHDRHLGREPGQDRRPRRARRRSTSRRRCGRTTGSAATSSAAMSTASAASRASSRSASRGSCASARRRRWRASSPTRARSRSTA